MDTPTNRLFKDWPKVFPDALNAEAIAKRLTERAEHFILDEKGYCEIHGIVITETWASRSPKPRDYDRRSDQSDAVIGGVEAGARGAS